MGIVKNIGYSFGINFVNFLFPIILTPYYIKVFGISNFGIIAICFAILNYLTSINDYSWNIKGPINLNAISNNYTDSKVHQYISLVINVKVILLLITILLFFILIQFYYSIKTNLILILSLLFCILGRSQNIHWVFVAVDKLKVFFIINSIFKLLTIFTIMLFFNNEGDFDKIFFVLSFFDILIFITCLIYLNRCKIFSYYTSSLLEIKEELKDGFSVFFSILTICVLSNSGTLILGIYLPTKEVGIYSVAEKIVSLCKHTVGILFQGIFPKIFAIGATNIVELKNFLRKIFLSYFGLYLFGGILLIFLAKYIVLFFSDQYIEESVVILRMLSFVPLIYALNQPAYIILVMFEKKKIYFNAYIIGLFFNIVSMFVMINFYGVEGLVYTLVLTELIITFILNYKVIADSKTNFLKI